MSLLSIDTWYVDTYLNGKIFLPKIPLETAHQSLQEKTSKGADYLGWIDFINLPSTSVLLENISLHAQQIIKRSDVFLVCGIGGSYLGARAVIEALWSTSNTQVIFLWFNLSGKEYNRVFDSIRHKSVSACIISKSGTTMETAIAYRMVRKFLLSKYSTDELQDRIITITDEKNGALRSETEKQWYVSYVLPDSIGGRYSVLTPVGLLPIAVAGIDIRSLIQGAKKAQNEININISHSAFIYAQRRVALEGSGFVSELFITSEPSLFFVGEWWKQLMGESHGKEWTGLYPDTLNYTTDLHSLGQYVQEWRRLFFESMLWIDEPMTNETIPEMSWLSDWLDGLVWKSLHDINLVALESTAKAHNDGGCPSLMIKIKQLDAEHIWYFLQTMMYACALSGVMIGVNPFDQPGVEAYKSEMRKRLK